MTSGAANAGLDNSLIYAMIHNGFPPSLKDSMQELGCIGHHPDGTLKMDATFIVSYESFASLLYQIFIVPIIEGKK
jgi:hypothetical protein